ncbi:hypothetical protein ACP70R_022230 [Stipagrostis hirtigluma subsp. patula]
MFGEMSASEWRSPSRVLEVSIRQVRYPVTENVLRQVFDRYGMVEEVQLFGGLVALSARVVFQSRHEAVEAYGSLHGRCIYDGCCQLDIQFGAFQELEAAVDTGRCDIMARSSAQLHASPASTMAKETVIGCDVAAALSQAIVATPSDTGPGARAICSTKCELSDVGVQAPPAVPVAATAISMTDIVIDTHTVPVAVLRSSDTAHSDIDDDTPTNCSTKCPSYDNGVLASADGPAALASPQTPKLLARRTYISKKEAEGCSGVISPYVPQIIKVVPNVIIVDGAISTASLDGISDNSATYNSCT